MENKLYQSREVYIRATSEKKGETIESQSRETMATAKKEGYIIHDKYVSTKE